VLGGTQTHWTRTPSGNLVGQRRTSRRYYVQDALGSTVALTDSTGAIKQRYSYDPYGKLANTPTATNPFRYAGGYTTQASNNTLYHYGARHYDPNLGRWTQQDPLDQANDLRQANRYVYVGADPVNLVDPSGELVPALAIGGFLLKVGLKAAKNPETRRRIAAEIASRFPNVVFGTRQALAQPGTTKRAVEEVIDYHRSSLIT